MTKKTASVSRKTLKIALILAIFGGALSFGLFFAKNAAIGEEPVIVETDGFQEAILDEGCIDEDINGGCFDEEMPYDLVEEKTVYPATSAQPEITWQKNAVSLGNFTPDKVYELEDAGMTFKITEIDNIAGDDGMINLVAIGMDENDNDYYTFRMTYPVGQDWNQKFVEFVTTFKN